MKVFGISTFTFLTMAAPTVAETQTLAARMAGRCWATHVLQAELVRPGTRTAEIATENAAFWRSQAAGSFPVEGNLENYLSSSLVETRAEGGEFMVVAVNAATCQTLRADIEPGYDPVPQNNGN